MKHVILGLGAIGGLMGTALSSTGEHVKVIVRPETLASLPPQLSLQRPAAQESLTGSVEPIFELNEPTDILWIATKTYQLTSALELIKQAPRYVVPLLNGIDHVSVLRERFGASHVLPATIAVEAERSGPGKFIQRSPLLRLNLTESAKPLLGGLTETLGKIGFTCQFIQNEQTLLWNKLCFLGPGALSTSASGKSVGEILADAEWSQKLKSAVAEACAVAQASGAETRSDQTLAFFDGVPPTMRSSMQKDVIAGRPLELEAIGGPIVRGGERFAIATPVTSLLMAAIRAKSTV